MKQPEISTSHIQKRDIIHNYKKNEFAEGSKKQTISGLPNEFL